MGHLKRNVLVDYKKSFVTQNGLYDKQDNLVLMIRPGSTDKPGDSAIDASKNSHTVTYDRSSTSQDPVQNDIDTPFSLRPVSFNPDSFNCRSQSDKSYVKVSDSDDLSFDDNTGPSPFSISMWVKGNPSVTDWSYIMGKNGEYSMRETTAGGALRISYLTDNTNYSYLHTTTVGLLGSNKWHHLVVTYNGIYNDREISIYVDGVLDNSGAGSVTGTYSGMTAGSNDLLWGTLYNSTGNKLSGKVSEMGIWNVVLSVADIKALYEVTQGAYKSGIVSNPPRVMLHDQDVRTGSYPTIMRTGDPDFSGKFASTFDDTNTIIFDTGEKLYPTNLFARHKFVSGGVATPNRLGGITAQGNSTAGVADAHVVFTPGENISPFEESKLYIDNDSQFYATGTTSGTLPGFDQRLSSMAQLQFVLSADQTTMTSDPDHNTGMFYYGFESGRWEKIGREINITGHTNTGRGSGSLEVQTCGFSPTTNQDAGFNQYFTASIGGIGMPIDNFGFPFHTKFHATSSQTYCLSASMTESFLLQKIVYEGPIGFGANTRNFDAGHFFMLLQSPDVYSLTVPTITNVTVATLSASCPADTQISNTITKHVTDSRRLITFSNIGVIAKNFTGSDTTSAIRTGFSASCDALFDSEADNKITLTYQSRRIEFFPKVAEKNLNMMYGELAPTSGSTGNSSVGIFRNFGGRAGYFTADGRSFIKPFPAAAVGAKVAADDHPSLMITPYETPFVESPVILNPDDKIVFGWEAGRDFESTGQGNTGGNLLVGDAKITFYGSLLRNNLPVDVITNQPLTSDAIHEDLHYNNSVLDQWDVEPFGSLSGSYVDLVITGSMLALDSLDNLVPEAPDVRQVAYSVAAGQAGPSGSMQRFVRLTDQRGTLYDSYPPDVLATLDILGYGAGSISDVGSATIMPGVPGMGFSSRGVIPFWWFIPAYEKNEKRFLAAGFGNPPIQTYNSSDTDLGSAQYVIDDVYLLTDTDLVSHSGYVSNDRGDVVKGSKALRNQRKALWGFGDSLNRAPIFELSNVSPKRWRPVIRGYKYGLAGIFGSSVDARFRRDRYGQFRDMLDQRKFPATIAAGTVEYPVSINFVPQDTTSGGQSSPEKTHSQNLSRFATSSLPYYDGQTKDRADNPDIVLAPIAVP